MMKKSTDLIVLAILFSHLWNVSAQPPLPIVFSFDVVNGLIYVLITIFFAISMVTPCVRYVYVKILSKWFDKAGKEISRVSKRISDRVSDAGRRVSQSVRSI